jgi:hypothetical protein
MPTESADFRDEAAAEYELRSIPLHLDMRVIQMEKAHALQLLRTVLSEISLPDGAAATDRFGGLREVDAKARKYE